MKTYIDKECKCYTTNTDKNFREFDIEFFNGKCKIFIEGHRYCPNGECYTRDDGEIFYGEMITPWKPYTELDAAQREYEQQLLAKYKIKENELNDSYQEGVNSI